MNTLKTLAVAAAAVALMGSTAMAADLVVPAPAAAMTSNWGGYAGVSGSLLLNPTSLEGDVFVGGDMTLSESFLIGGEVGIGAYNNLPGLGIDLYGAVRGGVVVGDSTLIYGKLGVKGKFGAGSSTRAFIGGGAEFKVSDGMSIRAEGTLDSAGSIGATIGALWHF